MSESTGDEGREPGYYWVRRKRFSLWQIAELANKIWWHPGPGCFEITDVSTIGPRLTPPQETE